MIQSLKKNWLVVSNMSWRIWGIFTKPAKSVKISLRWALYVQSIKVWVKKYGGVIFHEIEQWCKIWMNLDLVVSKMTWWIGWIFIKPLKSLENCTLMGLFYLKHIMFQLENFRGIMCHDTESWCKTWRKTDSWLEKWQKEFG